MCGGGGGGGWCGVCDGGWVKWDGVGVCIGGGRVWGGVVGVGQDGSRAHVCRCVRAVTFCRCL